MLLTFDTSGGIRNCYTSGVSEEDRGLITRSLSELGLLDCLKDANGPVRLKDTGIRPDLAELPTGLSDAKTFLGMPIVFRDDHVGNLYLIGKEGDSEFSDEDEDLVSVLSAPAALTISASHWRDQARQAIPDMETMMENCPVAVSVFDVRLGEISYLNRESLRMLGALGLAADELDNIFVSLKFTRPDGRELGFADLPGTRALQTGETVAAEEIVVHRPDGTTLTALVNCTPTFSGSGEMVSVLTVMQDMTPLENQELRRAEFLEMVSAELRTPLISIKGSAAALRSSDDPASRTEELQLLRIIDQQADLMRSQINSLIELTQIETGTLPVVAEPTDVARLIEWSCGEYLSEHAAITIQMDIADGLAAVLADRQHIGKVLHNILRQAAKHSGESSPVSVSAAMDDIHVAISVSAEGRFAPPDRSSLPVNSTEPPQFLKKVGQAHTKAVELMSQGEGLAMAFCRGVVEAHGGRMRVDEDELSGKLTLTFTLPSVEDVPEPEFQTPHSHEDIKAPAVAQEEDIRILLSIEDLRLLRAVRTELLNAGYDTIATSNLDEVEELASAERPKLILMDIAGREEASFRILRSAGNSLNLPAIVLCDRSDEEYVVRAFEMGADGYMVKPFSPSELIARIRATLRRLNIGEALSGNRTYELGDLRIDLDERTVHVAGQPVQLTATEYKLLTELSDSAGRVLTQDTLLQRVWGSEYVGEPQLLRAYVKSVRRKLGDDARKPRFILTQRGVGYRMPRPDPAARALRS
ncbi:MAG: winged helix-turn-helix domain-containing protein [Boseongicola sp.]|nr:winged helix-turn-helix domain-containing protein [Boseongicola sp.]